MKHSEASKVVVIFRDTILPISETFIEAQAQALMRYTPSYCGFYPAQPSLVPRQRASLLNPDDSMRSVFRLKLYQKLHLTGGFRGIKAKPVALIHAHFAPDGLSALNLSRSLRVPLIVTLHGYDVTRREELHRNYNPLWKRASLFLCVSSFIMQCAIKKGFPRNKLRVQPIGIDDRLFQGTPIANAKKVLFVGRLVEKKGCTYLLQAMQQVQASAPDVELNIIGDGPLRDSLVKEARALNVQARFLGPQNAEEIRSQMLDTAVFCVPSTTASDGDSEGLGMVFLEAQAMGLPVVSFHHGGIPEAVVDGLTGLLAPEGDVAGLAERILCYLGDAAKRTAAGVAGRQFVQEHFSLERRTKELERIYDDLVVGPTPTGLHA